MTCLFASIGLAMAQETKQMEGIVVSEAGEPQVGAYLIVEGTNIGTMTNENGEFLLYNVPSEATKVIVSLLGMTTTEADITSGYMRIVMHVDATFIEETVVVGYGSAKKVSSLVGSVQTVSSETLKNAPSSSPLDNLQGQVAGLSVLSSSGVAGDNTVSMTLHGVGSLGSSSTPLYVVDGVPSSARAIMSMNPNDIESISVLKDASATSIYGSRAANGVIYVTTKAGSYNEDATVTIRSQYGVSTLADMTLYENMMTGDELKDFWVRAGVYTEDYIKATYTDKGYDANTKWYEYFMNLNTPQYQNDITIQGGGRKVAYMVSASQFHQEGYTPGNYYDRYTVRTNVQGHPKTWLKTGLNIALSMDMNQRNGNWNSSEAFNGAYLSGGLSYMLNPLYPAVDENGKVYEKRFPNGMVNPNFYMANNEDRYDRYGFNGNFFVQIEPIKNLRIVSRAGIDGYFKLNNWHTNPSYVSGGYASTASAGKSTEFDYSATITNTIEYSFDINHDHVISVLAGQEGVANDYTYYYASSKGQTDDRQQFLQHGKSETYAMSESATQSRFLSFFGHADYSYLNKYYVDVTVRNDASSRFGSDVRHATFWSAGVRWNAKKEAFLQSAGWINDLNVKVSYGTQGNAAIGDYSSLGLISNSGFYDSVSARYVSQPSNSKLTWEQQALFTAGVSGRFWNFFDFEVEYYNRQTSSMLMDVPNPYTSGFTEMTQNVGTLENQGVDLTLGFDIYRTRDAYVRFNATFNYNKQTVTELFDGRERWEIANTGIAYVVGKPIAFYYPIYAGVDPADGMPMWYVPGENKDVTTMTETTKVYDEQSLIQNTGKIRYAPINGGFSLGAGWKGLSLQADFSYVIGKYLINNDRFFYENPNMNVAYNKHKAISDFWTPDNTDAQYPDWSKVTQTQFDSHMLEDASFLRLKNLQIGYALPKSALRWSKGVLNGLKITFTGRNLITCTKYSGIDPEVNSNLTYGMAGNSKQFLGGLEITF